MATHVTVQNNIVASHNNSIHGRRGAGPRLFVDVYSRGNRSWPAAAGDGGSGAQRTLRDRRLATVRDGTRNWVSGVLTAVYDETGRLTGYIRVSRDMTLQKLTAVDLENRVVERTKQLQETVAELRVNNKEKEVLLREVYHRVKNNLQVVQSLLKMRARSLRSVEAKRAIETSVERIDVMALAHERLYNMPDVTSLPMSTFLNDVIAGAVKANSEQPEKIDIGLDCEEIFLTLHLAIPFGLMLNELVTNSLKHGIPKGSPGQIEVSVRRVAGAVRMIVKDNGVGFPADFDLATCTSMGLKLASSLAHQLGRPSPIRVRRWLPGSGRPDPPGSAH